MLYILLKVPSVFKWVIHVVLTFHPVYMVQKRRPLSYPQDLTASRMKEGQSKTGCWIKQYREKSECKGQGNGNFQSHLPTCFPLFQEIIWFPEAVMFKSPCDNRHDISPDLSKPKNVTTLQNKCETRCETLAFKLNYKKFVLCIHDF